MVVARVFGKSSSEAVQREKERLAALQQLDLLDTPKDEGFERIVRLIKQVFSVDIGIVSLIDAHRQWYKACSGMSGDEVSLEDTFCRYVVDCDEPVIVPDASKDLRFATHPAVTGADHIRFYAGVPLRTKAGHMIGTVCAIDRRPRSFGSKDLCILEELAGAAMDRLELMQSAATDSLTEAMTRRAFKQEADQLISLALRHQHDLSCIVFDIDHFKKVNDGYGHAAGDAVLKSVASICRATLRAGDLFGRIGGEEFAVVLPHVDRERAAAVAEKLRTAIASQVIFGDHGSLTVTASLGTSALSIVSRDIETLLAQADAAMYQAKQGGRNRCVSWSSIHADHAIGARRRVLKAGSILFNDRRSTIDCTVKSIGAESAGISVSNTAGIPSEFTLAIKGEGFETNCRVIAQDRQNLEVAFR
ncbi:GGDEF/GAF domain-containing protein [Rhizobium sp. NXC14]|uniref:sensor domain-containing diguanylate cyclase n=1 Tax=Rhizobium sp. NXC14 TaxID=1981173 RepID=UPI000A20A4DD|nr:sensor domain-containing diguanylate cyclase [Rhizobium sp. NXC14]ARO30421.1 GGDEF/GAF domain-containing protein [Rhizobium sp. NXC14]